MRSTLVRLATTSAVLPLSVKEASIQLVPPIPLYRRILREHRYLPPEMRFMGDSYLKSEYRQTRSADNPLHIVGFLSQWKQYLDTLESARLEGNGEPWVGRKLDMEKLDTMSKEQVGQLYELMHATKEVWKSTEQLEGEAKEAGVGDADETSRNTKGGNDGAT